MSEFNRSSQPNKEPSKADINIIEKLLGPKAAAKYKGTGEGSESTNDVGYKPSVEDLSDLEALKEQEENIAESKRQMLAWAKESEVDESYIAENVTYEPNGDIIWEGDCVFSGKKNMTSFPPNLKEVRGRLDCRKTNIESLEGCPSSVTTLNCSKTKIENLEGCPSSVISLFCYRSKIASLVGCPSSVIKIDCSYTKIASLEGCPSSVIEIDCSYTKIANLVECPSSVIALKCSGCPNLIEIPEGLHTDLVVYVDGSQKELANDARKKGYTVRD